METKRVYLQELKEIMRKKAPQHFRGKIENSHGILKNLTEQSIVQLTQFFKPDVQGENIFESFTTRLWQSLKLREDIFVLHRFLTLLEEKTNLKEEMSVIFESLKNFMLYFESFTFKLLRYDDYDEFASFFNDIFSFKELEFNKIFEKIHNFNIFLETTLRHLSNRAELRDKPMDINKTEELLNQYL
jgi:glutathionyl-hydroquinone reductase